MQTSGAMRRENAQSYSVVARMSNATSWLQGI
jgi:hypothetical protein